jgi:hypothetical protein
MPGSNAQQSAKCSNSKMRIQSIIRTWYCNLNSSILAWDLLSKYNSGAIKYLLINPVSFV